MHPLMPTEPDSACPVGAMLEGKATAAWAAERRAPFADPSGRSIETGAGPRFVAESQEVKELQETSITHFVTGALGNS